MAKKTAGRKPRALLEVRGITRRFGERTILDGVDLDVAAGEAVGVVGPNGSGKSTLLRCIVGADEADGGEATLDGRVLDERRPDVRRDLAVVMDDIDFYPGTALDNSTGRVVLGPEAVAAPTAYSLELWFRTTSSSRSYLAGFEDDRDASYSLLGTEADRSVTMESSGRLTFGTWPGRSTSITTSRAYNDGAWHHLVTSTAGRLTTIYVDGALAASGTTSTLLNYTGYWRVGQGSIGWFNTPAFNGDLDNVAIYHSTLSAARVAAHWAAR